MPLSPVRPRARWFLSPLASLLFVTALPTIAHAQPDVPEGIRKAVQKANDKQLPKTKAAYKKITAVEPTIVVDWSTFETTADVQAMVGRLDGDVAKALKKKASTAAGKAAVGTLTTIRVKRQSTAECSADGGVLALAADWGAKKGDARAPKMGACLAWLAEAAPAPPPTTGGAPHASNGPVPAALRSAVTRANKDIAQQEDRLRSGGYDIKVDVDWSSFTDEESVQGLPRRLNDFVQVAFELGRLEGKEPLAALKRVSARYTKLAEGGGSLKYTAPATCSVANGVLAMTGDYGTMLGNASTPPFVECLYSLYPRKVFPIPATGPTPANIKAAVDRAEATTIPKLKATLKDKAGITPAFVINWAAFRSDVEVDAALKHFDEIVIPSLVKTLPKPRGKEVIDTVKTVYIDEYAGGIRCLLDGGVIRIRGAWGSNGPDRSDCELGFERVTRLRRRWDDMLTWQKNPKEFWGPMP